MISNPQHPEIIITENVSDKMDGSEKKYTENGDSDDYYSENSNKPVVVSEKESAKN